MRTAFSFLAVPLLGLAACGGSDPTPDPDESANAASIGNSVNEAAADQEAAENRMNEMEAANERGAARAEETIARDAAATGASGNEVIPPIED